MIDSSTISIVSEVGLVQECTYVEIPSSVPDNIVVKDGGGIESTSIKAKLYDDNDNLIDEPRLVRFVLNPIMEGTYLEEPGVTDTSVYTVNGIATVSVNSGITPGTVRVEVSVDCDEDGEYEINANAVPVIIASGAPYYIEPEYDPNSTTPIGGGFYKTQCAAIVYDKWYNPVEDSTYVYWSIDPIAPDTLIDAFVEGVSFTGNENLNGDNFPGVAYTTITYSTDAIGSLGQVSALTFGTNGDTIMQRINEEEGEAIMFFVPGQLTLWSPTQYWDFSTLGATAQFDVTGTLIDYYGNAVAEAPIMITATGAASGHRQLTSRARCTGTNKMSGRSTRTAARRSSRPATRATRTLCRCCSRPAPNSRRWPLWSRAPPKPPMMLDTSLKPCLLYTSDAADE